jgi:hypothetical protein
MTDQSTRALRRPCEIALILLAVASFLLYAVGVGLLRQDRAPGWSLEEQGPLPAAVSYLVYGTPLGAVDDNVARRFLQPGASSAQELLAQAAKHEIPAGAVDMYSLDAAGVGTNVFATVAMATFGLKLSSLIKLYLIFIGLTVTAFILRFRDRRLIVVPLYFLAVTVMLLTSLGSSDRAVEQVPIGGQRYFVLAAILPALHLFFELVERNNASAIKRRGADWLLLFVQSVLFFATVLVRSSVLYLLAPMLVVLIWKLWRDRKQGAALRSLWPKMAVVGAALCIWVAFVVIAVPAYLHTGRALGNVWHRTFVSFSLDPAWPYGNLREVYDCTRYIPEGLSRGSMDRNGHCIWWAYPPNQRRPMSDVLAGVYGAEYEAVMRRAYFYVVTHYPRQTFELYFNVKSERIGKVLSAAWRSLFELADAPVTKALFAIVAAQSLLFITFIAAMALADRSIVDRRMLIFPAFFLASLTPLYVAWATPWTSADAVMLFYACLVLAVLLVIQLAMKAMMSAPAPARVEPSPSPNAGATPSG